MVMVIKDSTNDEQTEMALMVIRVKVRPCEGNSPSRSRPNHRDDHESDEVTVAGNLKDFNKLFSLRHY
jgi:hypothetical protein